MRFARITSVLVPLAVSMALAVPAQAARAGGDRKAGDPKARAGAARIAAKRATRPRPPRRKPVRATRAELEGLARRMRHDILMSTTAAGSGHPTSSLSAVE